MAVFPLLRLVGIKKYGVAIQILCQPTAAVGIGSSSSIFPLVVMRFSGKMKSVTRHRLVYPEWIGASEIQARLLEKCHEGNINITVVEQHVPGSVNMDFEAKGLVEPSHVCEVAGIEAKGKEAREHRRDQGSRLNV